MNHAAYCQHWVRLLREAPEVLFQMLGEARRAVELVMPEAVAEVENGVAVRTVVNGSA